MGGTLFSFASFAKYLPITALVVFGGISPMVLSVAPALELHLVAEMGVSYGMAGGYFWGEMAIFGCGVLLAYGWCDRCDPRRVAFLALSLFAFGNLINALWMPTLYFFFVLRVIAGIGAGTLTVISVLAASRAPNHDRVFGIWLMGQMLIGTFALMILPWLFNFAGLRGLYMLLAFFGIVALPLAQFIDVPPGLVKKPDPVQQRRWRNWIAPVSELVGLLCFYIAIGSVWTFVAEAASPDRCRAPN
jgi:MFS family permease